MNQNVNTYIRLDKLDHNDLDKLNNIICRQLMNLIPDNQTQNFHLIKQFLPQSLERFRICANANRWWKKDHIDYLHSSQYCTLLYYLSNTIWHETTNTEISTRLFNLNKSLNAIDMFYEVELPSKFFIGHSVGIVFAKATYNDYFAIYQNSTIGKSHGVAPIIESCVLIYPNSGVIGKTHLAEKTVIAPGVQVVNQQQTPPNSFVFHNGNTLIFKPIKQNNPLEEIFYI